MTMAGFPFSSLSPDQKAALFGMHGSQTIVRKHLLVSG